MLFYPTDTAFGIGCRIDDLNSIEKLYKIRKRPSEKAMPVLFDSIDRVREYVKPFNENVKTLMARYWPGALTMVLPCQVDRVPEIVRGGRNSLGVRIPDHELALSLIKGVDMPLIGTSANFAGEKTPLILKELDSRLVKLVDFVLEGETKGFGRIVNSARHDKSALEYN